MDEQEITPLEQLLDFTERLLPEKRQEVIEVATREICYFPAYASLGTQNEKEKAALTHYFLSRNFLLELIQGNNATDDSNESKVKKKTDPQKGQKEEIEFSETFQNDLEADKQLESQISVKTQSRDFEKLTDIVEIWEDTDVVKIVEKIESKARDETFLVFAPAQTPENLYDNLLNMIDDVEIMVSKIISAPSTSFGLISDIWDEVSQILKSTLRYYRYAFSQYEDKQPFRELSEKIEQITNEQDILKFLKNIELIEKMFQESKLLTDICNQYFNRPSPLDFITSDNKNPQKSLSQLLIDAVEDSKKEFEDTIIIEVNKFQKKLGESKKLTTDLRNQKLHVRKKRKGHKTDDEIDDEIHNEIEHQNTLTQNVREIVRKYLEGKIISKVNEFVNLAALENYIIPHVVIVNNYGEDSSGRTYYGLIDRTSDKDDSGKYVQLRWLKPSLENIGIEFFRAFYLSEPTKDLRDTLNPMLIPVELIKNLSRDEKELVKKLRESLAEKFSLNELKDLSLDLGINYEALAGDEIKTKSNELVGYLLRRDRLDELYSLVRKLRPRLEL